MKAPKRLIVDIDEQLHKRLKMLAARNDTTIKTIVLHGLAAILQQEEENEAIRNR